MDQWIRDTNRQGATIHIESHLLTPFQFRSLYTFLKQRFGAPENISAITQYRAGFSHERIYANRRKLPPALDTIANGEVIMRRTHKRTILSIMDHPAYPFQLIAVKQEIVFEFLSNPIGGMYKIENSLMFSEPGNTTMYFLNETKKCTAMHRVEVTPPHLSLCIKLFQPSPEAVAALFQDVLEE